MPEDEDSTPTLPPPKYEPLPDPVVPDVRESPEPPRHTTDSPPERTDVSGD